MYFIFILFNFFFLSDVMIEECILVKNLFVWCCCCGCGLVLRMKVVGVGGVDDDDGGDGFGGFIVFFLMIFMLLVDGFIEIIFGCIDVLVCDFWIVYVYRYGCFLLMN